MGTGVEILLIASIAATAVSQVQAGRAASTAANFESAQYAEQAEMAKIEAANAALQRSEEADRLRRSNIAVASARGILPFGSASFTNMLRRDDELAARDNRLINLGGSQRVSALQGQSSQLRGVAKSSLKAGYLSAGATLIGGAYDYKKAKD
jgi:hypothetical protein